ncbi:hypothetical protein [Ammoniphilus sp. CFH 90114]|uniref:hypothetical protein n=1 Tax=Ammoniphilus sp. CFH 90114 TaxID=2493665 RepID=UPI00100FE23E|nr:hypothetical protein [Ammoniphilus sp. CFH 90114]RXT07773.1 hypothetical protein EIZ39_10085 [Ammoniphilus sp. CFH 90114]
MSKKKKSITPRRKRYNQQARLQNARSWISKYEGKNIVKGYSQWFGVDLLCAMKELEMLGYHIDESYRQQVKHSLKALQEHRRKRKEKKLEQRQILVESFGDDTFFFIAGYTSNGVPFGITPEEMERVKEGHYGFEDDELPF